MVTFGVGSALDRKLLRDLFRMRGQALAIASIVMGGVAVMVMALGALDSLEASRDAYYERYRFADVFATAKRAPQSLARKIEQTPGVKRVETRIVQYASLDIPGMVEPASGRLVSLPAHGRPTLNDLALLWGRLPSPRAQDEIVVSDAFAAEHGFRQGDEFAATINGRKRTLVVVGAALSPEFVYAVAPGALMPDDRRYGVIWMGRKALEAAFDLDGAFNEVSVSLTRGAVAEDVVDALDHLLDRYGGFDAYAREDHVSHAFLQGEMDQMRALASIVPPIFLIVATFLLNVILSRTIDTEREQIGLMKAFGYSNAEVGRQYLKLALAVTALGVLAGFAGGLYLARLLTSMYGEFYRFPDLFFRPNPSSFAIGALAAFAAAAVGALGAVGRAARLAPAEAMRPQPPVAYRKGVMEASGVFQRLDSSTRMIFRHLFRWPARAAATIAGVAAAGALMIGMTFTFDAIDLMAELFFERGGAYDAAITFTEPQHESILAETANLPGVLAVEPNRDVSATFSFGSRHKDTAIYGVDSNASMRNVVDENHLVVKIPEHGVALSQHLAKLLGAGPGDRITIEFREGVRPTVEVPVTAIVEDYIGWYAYMDRREVNRLLQEGPRISGVFVEMDEAESDGFYRAVKDRPSIAGVGLQSVAYQSFRDTIAETINIFMNIYRVLGGAIAAGVIYNAARIALSERSRELASLRVLGFTRGEASYILLGELAMLVMIALPIGCFLGYGLAALIAQAMATTDLYRIPLIVAPDTFGWATAVVLGASFLSALLVRRRIDRLDLIAVLKTRD